MAATINNNSCNSCTISSTLANVFAKAGDSKAVVAVKQRLQQISDGQVIAVRKNGYILIMFEDSSIAAVRADVLQQVLNLLEDNGIGWTEVLTDAEAEAVRRNQAATARRNHRCTPPVQHTTVYVDRGFDPLPHIGWGMRDMADDIGWRLQDAADDIGFFLDSLFF